MKTLYLISLGALLFLGCSSEKIDHSFDQELLEKVLVVPANLQEYEYFQQSIEKYRYALVEEDELGARYVGNRRSELSIRLLYPGATVSGEFGIIQLKGHQRDMKDCLDKALDNVVPGKSIIISGGCNSTSTIRPDIEKLNAKCISVDYVGQGPENDYLVLQLHAAIPDADSFKEALEKVKKRAPRLAQHYTF
jgi:hypothetical protein